MITQVETIAVYVSDQDRALSFFVEQLGFELRKDVSMTSATEGPRWIEVVPIEAETVLALATPPGLEDRIGRSLALGFQCDDIHAAASALKSRGVEFTQDPTEIPPGWWAAFDDPDGNHFGLSQSS